jgi:hypothetical protein
MAVEIYKDYVRSTYWLFFSLLIRICRVFPCRNGQPDTSNWHMLSPSGRQNEIVLVLICRLDFLHHLRSYHKSVE